MCLIGEESSQVTDNCASTSLTAVLVAKYTIKSVKIFSKLNNRPKSVRYIVKYSLLAIAVLSVLQIIYVVEIVPLYLKSLSDYDPFSGGELGGIAKDVGPFLNFISGFSSGLVATIVEIALISAFRLNKPYRQRSFVNLLAFILLSCLLAIAYIVAIVLNRQEPNPQNLGSILSFFILIPIFPYILRPSVRAWCRPKDIDFPNVDLNS